MKTIAALALSSPDCCSPPRPEPITGINSAASFTQFQFDDTNSLVPPAGTTLAAQGNLAWTGAPFSTSFLPDAITIEYATATTAASGSGVTYSVGLSGVTLGQVLATSGYAKLTLQFSVEYLLSSVLAPQATLFPTFSISGTVGPVSGSFASMSGSIDYVDSSNAAFPLGVVDTVNYNYFNNTPGAFGPVPVIGVPVNGVTPQINPTSVLRLNGSFTFIVDPSSLSVETVPEPTASLLVLLSLPLLLARRRFSRA